LYRCCCQSGVALEWPSSHPCARYANSTPPAGISKHACTSGKVAFSQTNLATHEKFSNPLNLGAVSAGLHLFLHVCLSCKSLQCSLAQRCTLPCLPAHLPRKFHRVLIRMTGPHSRVSRCFLSHILCFQESGVSVALVYQAPTSGQTTVATDQQSPHLDDAFQSC
jgi:hypothetical protein